MRKALSKMVFVGTIAMAMLVFFVQAGMATDAEINIGGLTGAQSWVWYEAEYANSHVNIAPGGANSGWVDNSGSGTATNNTMLFAYGLAGTASFNLPIDIPANMTNAYVYVRSNGYFANSYNPTVTANGNTVGTFTMPSISYGYENAQYWQTQTLNAGALSQGTCNLGASVTSGWLIASFDGVFISDGPIVTSNTVPLTPGLDSSGWMTAPTDAGVNSINGPVTPTFSITGDDTGGVTYTLNGVAYTPGTAITAPGTYQLSVIAFNAAGQRYMSGENFTLTPEPMTIGLLGIGSLSLLRRRRA
jgi:hypothetical protein